MPTLDLAVAFGAGLISITSPCCLPLLPGYLAYLSGLSPEQMATRRSRVLAGGALFVVGFGLVFVALGATASVLGALLLSYRAPLDRIAGIFVLVMGGVLLLESRLGWLSRGGDWSRALKGGRLVAAVPLGMAFAITWTPCIGPVLGAVLTLAATTARLPEGVALLAAYTAGLAVPFLMLAVSLDRVRIWLRGFGRAVAVGQYAAASLLLAMGVLLVSGRWLSVMAPFLAWYAQARWPPI